MASILTCCAAIYRNHTPQQTRQGDRRGSPPPHFEKRRNHAERMAWAQLNSDWIALQARPKTSSLSNASLFARNPSDGRASGSSRVCGRGWGRRSGHQVVSDFRATPFPFWGFPLPKFQSMHPRGAPAPSLQWGGGLVTTEISRGDTSSPACSNSVTAERPRFSPSFSLSRLPAARSQLLKQVMVDPVR